MAKLDGPILAALPTVKSTPRWMPTPQVAECLRGKGYDIRHVKTVLRRLQSFEADGLVISRTAGRATEWQRKEGASGLTKGPMSFEEALALQVLRRFATRQLPLQVEDYLKGLFDAAETRLKTPNDTNERRHAIWSRKVAMTGDAFQLIRPRVKEAVFRPVSEALFMERMLKFDYRKAGSDAPPKSCAVMPLGLVETADGLLYLVARTFHRDGFIQEPTRYRLDRMESAKLDAQTFAYPNDFQLSIYIEKDRKLNFFTEGSAVVNLRVSEQAGRRLLETPLAEDQQISRHKDGSMTVRATVVLSLRLREWLLAQGPQVEVVSPKKLRNRIAEEVWAMHGVYFDPDGLAEG